MGGAPCARFERYRAIAPADRSLCAPLLGAMLRPLNGLRGSSLGSPHGRKRGPSGAPLRAARSRGPRRARSVRGRARRALHHGRRVRFGDPGDRTGRTHVFSPFRRAWSTRAATRRPSSFPETTIAAASDFSRGSTASCFRRSATPRDPRRVYVAGCDTPFLAQIVPESLHRLPAHVIAYDSTYLPGGLVGAGGTIRLLACALVERTLGLHLRAPRHAQGGRRASPVRRLRACGSARSRVPERASRQPARRASGGGRHPVRRRQWPRPDARRGRAPLWRGHRVRVGRAPLPLRRREGHAAPGSHRGGGDRPLRQRHRSHHRPRATRPHRHDDRGLDGDCRALLAPIALAHLLAARGRPMIRITRRRTRFAPISRGDSTARR